MYSGVILGGGRFLPFLLSFQLLSLFTGAQTHYNAAAADLVINGTSTLHDWSMKSSKANCTATVEFAADGQIGGITGLSFSTPATALKSEHTSMDNNAYKALKTDRNPTIVYALSSVSVTASGGNSTVTCKGKLTIAGSTQNEEVVAICTINPDRSITITGTKKISMKDFQIDPPTFALGTIKTGNDITLTFHLTLKKA